MLIENSEVKVFACSASLKFAHDVCSYLNTELGKSESIVFSDGNMFVRILEPVRNKDVFVIQSIGLSPNDQFMELLFYIDAFKRASANSVTAIIPYFGYAKGDKKDEPRVSIRARVCADCLEVTGVDRIVTMDLHSPQIQGFFKKPVDHLYGINTLVDYIESQNITNAVVVSPDAGFAKNARKYANLLHTGVAIGDKTRFDHTENAQVLEIIGDIKGKNCIIVDDFSVSCKTLANLATTLKEYGALDIYACVTHALLSEEGLAILQDSPIISLITTDTVSNTVSYDGSKIKIVSIAPLFAKAISIIHNKESINKLFEKE